MNFQTIALVVGVEWIVFAMIFVLFARRSKNPEQRRDSVSMFGLFLQGIGLLVVPALPRLPPGAPLFAVAREYEGLQEIGVYGVAILLGLGSILLTVGAVRVLGKQWAYGARIVEGHNLIRSGPYQLVRHPIYTSMLGMNIMSALTFARWEGLLACWVLSCAGTWIRVRSEDRLLREKFGNAFTSYVATTPAILPGLRFRSTLKS